MIKNPNLLLPGPGLGPRPELTEVITSVPELVAEGAKFLSHEFLPRELRIKSRELRIDNSQRFLVVRFYFQFLQNSFRYLQ